MRPEGNRIELFRKPSSEQLFKQESTVMVVGHEPYLSSLIVRLYVRLMPQVMLF